VIPPEANAEFVYHMEDVLDVYTRPLDPKRPLVCLDEMPKQLIGEVRSPLPPLPGLAERFDYEYARNGVANIFCLCEPLLGTRDLTVTDHRTRQDWARLIKHLIDVRHPDADRIVLVLDNLNTHSPASLYETFSPQEAKRLSDKLEIHYTPKHGSWLNIAEIELSVLSRQCLDRRIADVETLKQEVHAHQERRDALGTKVNWRFTTTDARIKLKRLYPSLDS
jgi:hypothetical protein